MQQPFCSCGAANRATAKFCSRCGGRLGDQRHSRQASIYQQALEGEQATNPFDRKEAANLYINRSYAFMNLGRNREALDACDQAIRLDPAASMAYANKAGTLISLGMNREALDACDQALQCDPHDVDMDAHQLAHLNASQALINLEKYQQALAACEQAIRLDPTSSKAYALKAVALSELGRHQESLEASDQALRLSQKR